MDYITPPLTLTATAPKVFTGVMRAKQYGFYFLRIKPLLYRERTK